MDHPDLTVSISMENSIVLYRVNVECCHIAGVRNIQALGNLISWQKVEYDFNYHKQDFLANVSTLVLSEGKSLLPVGSNQ